MLITNNNIELRNLQEQVLKNKEDIARHYEIDRTLANFGIKIVGTVATVNDLPDPTLYEGSYGDGYAVGQTGSYNYYIFTRPDPNSGQLTNYWLDVGELGIQGPQGPRGPQGPQGPQGYSTKWFTNGLDALEYGKPGDLWLDTMNGNVYVYSDTLGQWVLTANIKGPQGIQGIRGPQGLQGEIGPQGPKGDTGDVGGFINIAGILNNESSLPLPTDLNNLTVAYLVGTASPYELYIQVGSDSDTAIWENMGPLNVATYVTVNGQFQNVWNADTKLDKVTTEGQDKVYMCDSNGNQTTKVISSPYYIFSFSTIPVYCNATDTPKNVTDNPMLLISPATPTKPYHAANKKWVEDNFTVYKHIVSFSVYDYGLIDCHFVVHSSQSTPFTAKTLPIGVYVGWSGDHYNFLISNDGGSMYVTRLRDPIDFKQYLLGDELFIDRDIVMKL